jgi:hypothetical protein
MILSSLKFLLNWIKCFSKRAQKGEARKRVFDYTIV